MNEQQPELGRFLRARRAGVSPADLGLPAGQRIRRTPGLRREELAALAGVSIDYYIRLERGKETRPSPAVVEALGRALRLDAEELTYLREVVARAARGSTPSRPAASRAVRPTLKQILESVRPCPAYLLGRTNDMLATNPSGLYLTPGMADWPARKRNTIRYTFLHPQAHSLWPDWETKARNCVAHLRAVAGSDPDDPELAALVGELAVKSPEFSRMWERYDVRRVGNGRKTFLHPDVGTMTLSHEVMEVNQANGARIVVYSAEPGTPDHDAMVLLDMKGAGALDTAGGRDVSDAEAGLDAASERSAAADI
ncbi:helix-turn-helix domain-containing protein [Catenulispora sp. NF23]|uniref:Helix-turn-helix domain-containing protein n=1 Tax=Catenulispora pinistramenti TaxID=2705254 RepID=A0ABS5L142_9ACTN|nr:helix-turn-helix transcriptional regulator [Catenulispora pinistramenti]MBS2535523.1 helix-turn-helix domain-containing protein [Catenulispora pinistramenti]MBS2552043.1 helix-turn-helix domain-containing protein [Catenulispora pinistramenti]